MFTVTNVQSGNARREDLVQMTMFGRTLGSTQPADFGRSASSHPPNSLKVNVAVGALELLEDEEELEGLFLRCLFLGLPK